MTWLVTGGAGYIGAHVIRALREARLQVVAFDDLTTGRRVRLANDVPLVVGSVRDQHAVRRALKDHHVQGVIHLAGRKRVCESATDPLTYYRENVEGCQVLLQAMVDLEVPRLVFSSSAAVYGLCSTNAVREDAMTAPINPYGRTKLMCEQMIRDVGQAYDLNWIALRYFNVAGTAAPPLADTGATNLIPLLLQAARKNRTAEIFGDDYPTPDGTCIRDFIHVTDVAHAHALSANALDAGRHSAVYNVGRGQGASVREVLNVVRATTGIPLQTRTVERRPGDAPEVVADATAIRRDLGWSATRDLVDMVESAWAASQPIELPTESRLRLALA